jgi:hypothetical protein
MRIVGPNQKSVEKQSSVLTLIIGKSLVHESAGSYVLQFLKRHLVAKYITDERMTQ